MTTLDYILQKFQITLPQRSPIELPIRRVDLAYLFAELNFLAGVEMGVERGLFTEVLCQANPQAKIYAVDAWAAYGGYREHVSQDKLDGFYAEAVERLRPYNCAIMRRFSVEAAEHFASGELDFVYIDGNHEFRQVVNDISEWLPKVRKGGIIAGHDYREDKKQGALFHVKSAVHGYTDAYKISPWFVLRGDHSASWMWVK